jgi:hypothetical protein
MSSQECANNFPVFCVADRDDGGVGYGGVCGKEGFDFEREDVFAA